MDIIQTTQDLMRFRTETGNISEIKKCLEYCQNLFAGQAVKGGIFEYPTTSPVLFLANADTNDFDVLCLGHLDVVPASDDMFEPKIADGKLYERGSLDMKAFAVVALNSLA